MKSDNNKYIPDSYAIAWHFSKYTCHYYVEVYGIVWSTNALSELYGLRTAAKMQNKAKSFKVEGPLRKSMDFFACQAEVSPEVDTKALVPWTREIFKRCCVLLHTFLIWIMRHWQEMIFSSLISYAQFLYRNCNKIG